MHQIVCFKSILADDILATTRRRGDHPQKPIYSGNKAHFVLSCTQLCNLLFYRVWISVNIMNTKLFQCRKCSKAYIQYCLRREKMTYKTENLAHTYCNVQRKPHKWIKKTISNSQKIESSDPDLYILGETSTTQTTHCN